MQLTSVKRKISERLTRVDPEIMALVELAAEDLEGVYGNEAFLSYIRALPDEMVGESIGEYLYEWAASWAVGHLSG